MTRDLQVLPQADADIEESFYYLLEQGGLERAFDFIDRLNETFERLREMPQVGRRRDLDDPRYAGLRSWPVKKYEKHLIFYVPGENVITVFRVLHASRDIDALFEEEGGA